jgi:hypothetical protein
MPAISQDVADKASVIQRTLNEAIAAARNDTGLNEVGKRDRIAKAYQKADQDMRRLKDSWQTKAEQTTVVLGKDVFGAASTSGADAISIRDADDRASRIETPDEAANLLGRAEENGDTVLARAIAQRAYGERSGLMGNAWSGVLDTYTESRPDVAEKLNELNNARRNSIRDNLQAGWTFSLNQPREIQGLRLEEV